MAVEDKDYLLRLAREIARTIAGIILGRDLVLDQSPSEVVFEDEQENDRFHRLTRMIDDGLLNEAENDFLEHLDCTSKDELEIGIRMYLYMNEKSDEELDSCEYSREEIEEGLKNLAAQYGFKDSEGIFS